QSRVPRQWNLKRHGTLLCAVGRPEHNHSTDDGKHQETNRNDHKNEPFEDRSGRPWRAAVGRCLTDPTKLSPDVSRALPSTIRVLGEPEADDMIECRWTWGSEGGGR